MHESSGASAEMAESKGASSSPQSEPVDSQEAGCAPIADSEAAESSPRASEAPETEAPKAEAPEASESPGSPHDSPHNSLPSPFTSMAAPADDIVLLSKFTLYETRQSFYIVGSNTRETRFRIMEIPLARDAEGVTDATLEFREHGVLSRAQVLDELSAIQARAEEAGDVLSKRISAWGILGVVKFTENYYICLVTRCSAVALLGGHYIFHIDETRLVPIMHSSAWRQPDRRSTEARLAYIFHSLDLTKTFYFSPSYDLTHTLQTNLCREKSPENRGQVEEMYVWNCHLLAPMLERFPGTMEWCLSAIHGFIDQAKVSVFGAPFFVTLIARRSHYFAGARFFKRGVNNQGRVANEVETEQIVSSQLTSSFHDPRRGLFNSPRYTSYVQHRGSICLQWSQDTANISPKPPIRLDNVDPYYAAGARHFDNLFDRYGCPVRVFNLVKQNEHTVRESLLSREFEKCIDYLNQFLPDTTKIDYTAWDMSSASKAKSSSEVIEYLEAYAHRTIAATGIFHNGYSLQQGVCRTNCIDCLDRTNAAQSVIGKVVLGYQLQAMGILDAPHVNYDSDVADLLTEMYHDHGDTLALQYGGSNLVNSVETYRKINQWTSHSRDLIESIRRFYTNSFVDAQRQDAINLFLGHFQWSRDAPNLWDLSTDYYLHHLLWDGPSISYTQWFTPAHIEPLAKRIAEGRSHHEIREMGLGSSPRSQLQFEPYWNRLYRPRVLTTLAELFVMQMNSADRYRRSKQVKSPFEVHKKHKHRASHSAKSEIVPGAALQGTDEPSVTPEIYENYLNGELAEPDSYEKFYGEPEVDESEYTKSYDTEWTASLGLEWPVTLAS